MTICTYSGLDKYFYLWYNIHKEAMTKTVVVYDALQRGVQLRYSKPTHDEHHFRAAVRSTDISQKCRR